MYIYMCLCVFLTHAALPFCGLSFYDCKMVVWMICILKLLIIAFGLINCLYFNNYHLIFTILSFFNNVSNNQSKCDCIFLHCVLY